MARLAVGGSKPEPAPLTAEQKAKIDEQRLRLFALHPGFRTSRSVMLHKSSTDGEYATFRHELDPQSNSRTGRILTRRTPLKEFTVLVSERNAIALFGSGKIDAIPDQVLIAAATTRYEDYPEVSGRVARLKNGFIGKFGWKAQKARLSDFVLTACAVEVGLNVPGEPQSGMPHKPDYVAQGLDLNAEECQSLTTFIGELPTPVERKPANAQEAEYLAGGRKLFATLGCATCHTQQLGDVAGIYSDLLLHDMGQSLGDSGSYSSFASSATDEQEVPDPPLESAVLIREETHVSGAADLEWRTPPLWGLRDSAPYLHDGRAETIEQAVALHGGEATRSARLFFRLSADERLKLTLFLRSLEAPR